MSEIEKIMDGSDLVALIVRSDYETKGVDFATAPDEPQQLGLIGHQKGTIIASHYHPPAERKIATTTETLIIKKGRLRVDLYRGDQTALSSHILSPHDLIMIFRGGHGFEVLEDLQMIEVKQGPFMGEADKVRFQEKKS
ncbi:MAG: hypothetical protein ACJ76H_17435 [Bacteriovoracaceae bacterium]